MNKVEILSGWYVESIHKGTLLTLHSLYCKFIWAKNDLYSVHAKQSVRGNGRDILMSDLIRVISSLTKLCNHKPSNFYFQLGQIYFHF